MQNYTYVLHAFYDFNTKPKVKTTYKSVSLQFICDCIIPFLLNYFPVPYHIPYVDDGLSDNKFSFLRDYSSIATNKGRVLFEKNMKNAISSTYVIPCE